MVLEVWYLHKYIVYHDMISEYAHVNKFTLKNTCDVKGDYMLPCFFSKGSDEYRSSTPFVPGDVTRLL